MGKKNIGKIFENILRKYFAKVKINMTSGRSETTQSHTIKVLESLLCICPVLPGSLLFARTLQVVGFL